MNWMLRNTLSMQMQDLNDIPKYWALLSNADRYQYTYLKAALSNSSAKFKSKNKKGETFIDTLEAIKRYCVRGDCDDWRRFLVTGIAWLNNGAIAVNTHQLRILLVKCKSSINGSLHKMGFNYGMERSEAASELIQTIPLLKDNPAELRQWTVRHNQPLPSSASPPISPSAASPVENSQQIPIQVIGIAEDPSKADSALPDKTDDLAFEFGESSIFDSALNEELDFGYESSIDNCLW